MYDYEMSGWAWSDTEGKMVITKNGWAKGINNRGEVVGVDYGTSDRAFIWEKGSGISGLGPQSGFSSGRANAVSNNGDVVGSVLVSQNESAAIRIAGSDDVSPEKRADELLRRTGSSGVYDPGHVAEMIRSGTFNGEAFPWERDTNIAGKGISVIDSRSADLARSSTFRSEAFIWNRGIAVCRAWVHSEETGALPGT